MKQTMLFHILETLRSHWKVFVILTIALTSILFGLRLYQLRPYQKRFCTTIRPLVLNPCSNSAQKASVNPCYITKQILGSESFRRQIQEYFPELSTRKFNRCFSFHETDDHLIHIEVVTPLVDDSRNFIYITLRAINTLYWGYNSNQLKLSEPFDEAIVSDYLKMNIHYSDNILYDELSSFCQSADTVQQLCFDIVDAPEAADCISDMEVLANLLVSFFISALTALFIAWIYQELQFSKK